MKIHVDLLERILYRETSVISPDDVQLLMDVVREAIRHAPDFDLIPRCHNLEDHDV